MVLVNFYVDFRCSYKQCLVLYRQDYNKTSNLQFRRKVYLAHYGMPPKSPGHEKRSSTALFYQLFVMMVCTGFTSFGRTMSSEYDVCQCVSCFLATTQYNVVLKHYFNKYMYFGYLVFSYFSAAYTLSDRYHMVSPFFFLVVT